MPVVTHAAEKKEDGWQARSIDSFQQSRNVDGVTRMHEDKDPIIQDFERGRVSAAR